MPIRLRTPSGIRKVLAESTNFGGRSSNVSHDDLVLSMPKPNGGISPSLLPVFHKIDSSESVPSSHQSVYNAQSYTCLRHSLDERQSEVVFATGGASFEMLSANPECTMISTALPTASVHHPTPLETITEQKSIATLRDGVNLNSLQKASVLAHLSRRASAATLRNRAKSRRRKAFSLNDLAVFRISRKIFKKWTSSIDSSAKAPPGIFQSSQPVRSPPLRAPTPKGLPTFNTTAAATYHLPPPPLRFKDWFRFNSSAAEDEWAQQTAGLPRDAVMRGDNGVLVKGRWRPVQSGHTGNSNQYRQRLVDVTMSEPVRTPNRSHAEITSQSNPAKKGRFRAFLARANPNHRRGNNEGNRLSIQPKVHEKKRKRPDGKPCGFLVDFCACGNKVES